MLQPLTLVFSSLGVLQALMLTVYLFWLRPGKRLANVFLGLILLGLSIRIGKSVFNHFYEISAIHRNIGLAGFLMVGPAYWCYATLLRTSDTLSFSRQGIHFLPALGYTLCTGLIPNDFSVGAFISYALVMLQYATYVTLGFFRLYPAIKDEYPDHGRWFLQLTAGLALLWTFYASVSLGLMPYYIGGAITYSILIGILTLTFLTRNKLPHDADLRTCLSHSDGQHLLARLDNYLVQSEAYLEPKLSLQATAGALEVDARVLSGAINQYRNTNFSDYINLYRLERAKKLLTDPEYPRKKMLAIALESGFSNTARFNQVFKHYTQLTPTQFRSTHP